METLERQLVPFASSFADQCESLIASLPEWFGLPESNAAYLRDLERLPSWLLCEGSRALGAASLARHFPGSFEVHFMAVRPECHRRGIGRNDSRQQHDYFGVHPARNTNRLLELDRGRCVVLVLEDVVRAEVYEQNVRASGANPSL